MTSSIGNKTCGELGLGLMIIWSLCTPGCAPKQVAKGALSQFAGEAGKEKYEEVAPPAAAPVFRWDFSKPGITHAYTYEQQVRNKMDMGAGPGGAPNGMGQEMSGKGVLTVNSQGDGTAELVLKDLNMSMKMDMGKEGPKTMESSMPPSVLQGMKEDGSGPFGECSPDMMLQMLFPLPSKTIKIGEFDDIPSQMPFNAMGSVLPVKGRSRITLARYVKIGKRTCAQFDVDIDVSELKVPAELKGEYKCSTKGASTFYFDIEERSFVSGTVTLLMQLSADAPMPQVHIAGEKTPDMPERTKMSMVSDNLIRVALKE